MNTLSNMSTVYLQQTRCLRVKVKWTTTEPTAKVFDHHQSLTTRRVARPPSRRLGRWSSRPCSTARWRPSEPAIFVLEQPSLINYHAPQTSWTPRSPNCEFRGWSDPARLDSSCCRSVHPLSVAAHVASKSTSSPSPCNIGETDNKQIKSTKRPSQSCKWDSQNGSVEQHF